MIPALVALIVSYLIFRDRFVHAMPHPTLVMNRFGFIHSFNEEGKKLIGSSWFLQKKASPLGPYIEELLDQTFVTRKAQKKKITIDYPKFQSFEINVSPYGMRYLVTILNTTRAESMQVMGKNFVSNASHELRTPITIIRGFAEMLQDMKEVSEDILDGVIDKILKNCNRMSALVQNLLTLADLDNTHLLDTTEFDLVDLVDGCNQNLMQLHPEAHIELLHNAEKIIVDGVPDLVELAFMNVIQNGIKYSKDVPHITTIVELRDNTAFVRIEDKGKGIPEDDLPHIFERFYTVDKTHSRKLGGAGLGLSIVKRICDIHNFTLSVSSVEGEGTSFEFALPCKSSSTILSLSETRSEPCLVSK